MSESSATTVLDSGPDRLGPWLLDVGRFDAGAFEHLAQLSVAVYDDEDGFEGAARRVGYDFAALVDHGAAEAGVVASGRHVVVVSRGSKSTGDWFDDLRSLVRVGWKGVLPKGVRVGWGFRQQAKKLVDPIVELLEARFRANEPPPTIVVTGHSLGAALVPLLMAGLRSRNWVCSVGVQHEPPRSGNERFQEFAERSLGRIWNVTNATDGESDLVTRVPKRSWGFRHVGVRLILAQHGIHLGLAAWQTYRAASPVGHYLAAWRIVSRTIRAVRAHFGHRLVQRLNRARLHGEVPA